MINIIIIIIMCCLFTLTAFFALPLALPVTWLVIWLHVLRCFVFFLVLFLFCFFFFSFVNGHTTEELLDVYVPNLQLLPFRADAERSASAQIQTHYFCFLGILRCFPPPFNSRCTFLCAHIVFMTTSHDEDQTYFILFCSVVLLGSFFFFFAFICCHTWL